MKKKHEIIKYAYENFPKGTLFRLYKGVAPFVSTGKFKFEFSDNNALFVDLTDDSTDAGVTVFDGEKWAEIVPLNDISKVFNVGDHVYIKSTDAGCNLVEGRKAIIVSNDTIANRGMLEAEDYDYKIAIDGEVWRVKGEFEPAKFVIRSEDGVDLYSGMEFWGASYSKALSKWRLDTFKGGSFILDEHSGVCGKDEDFPYLSTPKIAKAFSTKEAAEKWIDEKNKPKEIELFHKNTATVKVRREGISIVDKLGTFYSSEEVKEIYNTWLSLQ